jgi:hypothetical protein
MKKVFGLAYVLILLSLGGATAGAGQAGGCSGSGCGGNFSATEFQDLLTDAIVGLKKAQVDGKIVVQGIDRQDEDGNISTVDVSVDVGALDRAFRSVSVVGEKLYVGGMVVDFKSTPSSGHVDFTEDDWKSHPSKDDRMRMVIHELLMLASRQGHPEYDDYMYRQQLSRRLRSIAAQALAAPPIAQTAPTPCLSPEQERNQRVEHQIGILMQNADQAFDEMNSPKNSLCVKSMQDLSLLMTDHTIDTLQCTIHDPSSAVYQQSKQNAKAIEALIASHVALCAQNCASDPSAVASCNQTQDPPLPTACP